MCLVVCPPKQHSKKYCYLVHCWVVLWLHKLRLDVLVMISILTGSQFIFSFCFVLWIPGHGLFILPFGAAGNGARYLWISSGFMSGMPLIWPFAIAFRRVAGGKFKNVWCMYFICCCLYGSVCNDVAAVCLICLLAIAKFRCCAGFFSSGLIRLTGSRHKSVIGHLPPTNAYIPL
jgi:hypothetical protein